MLMQNSDSTALKHTSCEAINEATPMGMNTMVTIKNAEITCSESNTPI